MDEIKKLKLFGNILTGIYFFILVLGISSIGIIFPNVYDTSNKAGELDLNLLTILILVILVLGFIVIKEFNNYIKNTEEVIRNEKEKEKNN